MKKLLTGFMIGALILGAHPVFAAESEKRHTLDDQKKQAKMDYEQQRDDLKSKYQGDDLEKRLQKAYSDYMTKAKMLDQEKKVGEDPGDVNQNGQ
jgi:hypothetical protein